MNNHLAEHSCFRNERLPVEKDTDTDADTGTDADVDTDTMDKLALKLMHDLTGEKVKQRWLPIIRPFEVINFFTN